jgi:hypothetical protein
VVVSFSTRCNNNLSIDYADQNYFASSALDQPGIMIWDRRATSRPVCSPSYLQAVDEDDLPWGGALRLDRAIEMDPQSTLADSKHSFIRSLRFCRDQRGLLAVLSRTGQLKVLQLRNEAAGHATTVENSPGLQRVYKSHDLDIHYSSASRKNNRIVSFDWITLGSPVLRPRMLALRANGVFDIVQEPSYTSDCLYGLVPWQPPHRGLHGKPVSFLCSLMTYSPLLSVSLGIPPLRTMLTQRPEDGPYMDIMHFEPSQVPNLVGPVFVEQALADVQIFAPDHADLHAVIEKASMASIPSTGLVAELDVTERPLPETFSSAKTTAEKLRALRAYVKDDKPRQSPSDALAASVSDVSLSPSGPPTNSQLHDDMLATLIEAKGLPREAMAVIDHVMLLRAREKYLFDPVTNTAVVSDDPWLEHLWQWIGGRSTPQHLYMSSATVSNSWGCRCRSGQRRWRHGRSSSRPKLPWRVHPLDE